MSCGARSDTAPKGTDPCQLPFTCESAPKNSASGSLSSRSVISASDTASCTSCPSTKFSLTMAYQGQYLSNRVRQANGCWQPPDKGSLTSFWSSSWIGSAAELG